MTGAFIPPLQPVAAPPVASLPSPVPSAPYDGPDGVFAPALGDRGAAAPASFGSLFAERVREVDASLRASQLDLQRLAAGEPQNLHQVMVKLEEARIGFQLMLQVRNRLLESYQDVMRMQV